MAGDLGPFVLGEFQIKGDNRSHLQELLSHQSGGQRVSQGDLPLGNRQQNAVAG